MTAPNVPADAMKSILLEVQREEKAKEGKGGQGSERQATRAQAGAQGRRSARVQEGKERRAHQEPGEPQGTWGGRVVKEVDRGASGQSHSSRLGSSTQDPCHELAQR